MSKMNYNILVIDDEKDFIWSLKAFLESMGYRVTEANNAVQGGISLNTGNPDLIIMDLRMPGINGFDACRAMCLYL